MTQSFSPPLWIGFISAILKACGNTPDVMAKLQMWVIRGANQKQLFFSISVEIKSIPTAQLFFSPRIIWMISISSVGSKTKELHGELSTMLAESEDTVEDTGFFSARVLPTLAKN